MIRRSEKIGLAVCPCNRHERKPAERFTLETGEPEAAGNV
jgi:ferredoxin-thioredoxin reductase catalytic subunit